jgi:RimJ/RimL family protein N-acetyltransferase
MSANLANERPTTEGGAPGFTPLTLEGSVIRLEPMRLEHAPLFWEAARGAREETFRWFPWSMSRMDDFTLYVQRVLAEQEKGLSVAFATVVRESGQIVGSTRFMNIDAANRHLEIGSTWIVPAWQRTAVNAEAKYLMLRQAFEAWGCLRVELRTDALNQQSRTAILRLGAKEEGTFRKHVITSSGRVRDSVYFSIVDTEWPGVKARLEKRLER